MAGGGDVINRMDTLVNEGDMNRVATRVCEGFRDTLDRQREPLINFAWEDSAPVLRSREKAVASVRGTSILVVIGYSFPLFNRDVDAEILAAMGDLAEVYVQCGNDGPAVRERLLSTASVDSEAVRAIQDVNQFHLPYGASA